MLQFLCVGNWSPGQVHSTWTANTRRVVPDVERAIDIAWNTAASRPGVNLFDGPMCRLESWKACNDRLDLGLSRSSYKPFLGTNMTHPDFTASHGPDVMANPVGLSTALLTVDGKLLLGQRNALVAYYPNRVHPFAGSLEPDDPDVFTAVGRELLEELAIEANSLLGVRCIGMAEDLRLRQPELIFAATSSLSSQTIVQRLDPAEHTAVVAVPATASDILDAVTNDPRLTPIAVASILMWGRLQFGDEWFGQVITMAVSTTTRAV